MWDQNRIIAVCVAAILGAGGSLTVVSSRPEIRADPMTASMAKAMEDRIMSRIERTQSEALHQLEKHRLTGHSRRPINDEI